jgi:hypothetical protein
VSEYLLIKRQVFGTLLDKLCQCAMRGVPRREKRRLYTLQIRSFGVQMGGVGFLSYQW